MLYNLNMQKYTFRITILVLTTLVFTACGLGSSPQATPTISLQQMVETMSPPTATEAPLPTATAFIPTATDTQPAMTDTPTGEIATATATLEATPATGPAQVVQNFLQNYGGDPATVATFLSAALQAQYPGSQVNTLLPISGTIKGVALQSESIAPDPPFAEEVIALRNENTSYLLVFDLIEENGVWVINKVVGL
jgi:hypothetical protein